MQSPTTLYICRLPANRMHTIGVALIWKRAPQVSWTITIVHHKYTTRQTCSTRDRHTPPPRLKQVWRRTDGRAHAQNITSPAGRLADYKKILFEKNNFDLTWCWMNKRWPEVTGQVMNITLTSQDGQPRQQWIKQYQTQNKIMAIKSQKLQAIRKT